MVVLIYQQPSISFFASKISPVLLSVYLLAAPAAFICSTSSSLTPTTFTTFMKLLFGLETTLLVAPTSGTFHQHHYQKAKNASSLPVFLCRHWQKRLCEWLWASGAFQRGQCLPARIQSARHHRDLYQRRHKQGPKDQLWGICLRKCWLSENSSSRTNRREDWQRLIVDRSTRSWRARSSATASGKSSVRKMASTPLEALQTFPARERSTPTLVRRRTAECVCMFLKQDRETLT